MLAALSLGWDLYTYKEGNFQVALSAARVNFEKDLLYRRWATVHGGVYASVSPETPPNPYLAQVPERDIQTPSGRQLTLINPAYMVRQVYDFAGSDSKVQGHLTSLKPLRPENVPDAWEALALKSFEQGNPEAHGAESLNGRPYLRLMKPLHTEKGCLKCHAHQGYREGDIRGGISVSIPLEPLWAAAHREEIYLFVGHGVLWLLGCLGIIFMSRRLGRSFKEQRHAEGALREANFSLRTLVDRSQQRNREISLINEMSDQLHACVTLEEAHRAVGLFMPRLFPDTPGALFLLNASKNHLELAVSWGGPILPQTVFSPPACWALRRGRAYLLEDTEHGLFCDHLIPPLTGPYLCVPMAAQGETLGIFHVQWEAGRQAGPADESNGLRESIQTLALAVSDHLALALANLRLQEILRHQAIRDPLTGLFNRRFMEETLERELSRAHRQAGPLGVIMMDLDHFKNFNDTYGHAAGDLVLSALGRLLQSGFRKEDVPCRYGGEELTIIMPEATLADTWARAEEVRQAVKNLQLQREGQALGQVTVSLGVAAFPEHGDTPETLLQAADVALYRAKRAGRDRLATAGEG